MKEKLLKMGFTEEQIEKILSDFVTKEEYQKLEEKNKKDVELLNTQLEDLKKGAGVSEELKKQIETLQNENKAKEEEYKQEIYNIKLNNEVENLLNKAGSKNNIAVKALLLKMENIKLENDKIIGLSEQLEEVKKNNDYLFNATEVTTGFKPTETVTGAKVEKVGLAGALAGLYSK